MAQFTSSPALQARSFDIQDIQRRSLQNQLLQSKLQQAQSPQADPRLALDREKFEFSQGKDQRAQEMQKLEQIAGLLAPFADPDMPELQKAEMWPKMLQRAQAMGLPIDKAPPQYDPQWVALTMGQVGKYQAEKQAGGLLSPEVEAQKIRISRASKASEKPLAIERKLRLAGIDPKSEEGQKFIRADLAGQQISFKQGADGAVEVIIGKGVGGGMEKKTRGNLEKSLVSAREGLSRLRDIAAKFRPEFQEIPTRIGVAWTGLKARFGSGDVSSEDRQALTEFADYRRTALSNINLYIKEITGAQMSIQEADRLRKALPDPGEGIFGGDDPITFKAHLDSVMLDLERSVVRFKHYLAKGITNDEEIARLSPLDTMRTAINEQSGERLVEIAGEWVPLQ